VMHTLRLEAGCSHF